MNYWLHRISHCMEVSHPLLFEYGYLSIGFSDFALNQDFLDSLNSNSDIDSRWKYFENENLRVWGDKYRTRHNLWRFLCKFEKDDYIIVPVWSEFYVYKVEEKPIYIGEAIPEGFKDRNGKTVVRSEDGGKCISYYDGEGLIDLGFAIKVSLVAPGIDRSKYAPKRLLSRLKLYQTNADISDLETEIKEAIDRYNGNQPISLYAEVFNSMSETWKNAIEKYVNDNQFERLIACYFKSIGADEARVLPKRIGKGNADGDVIARFDKLNIVIYVQAKDHTGETSEWAVEQISELRKQKNKEEYDNGYIIITWAITAAERFSEQALIDAKENNVRLIAGPEFRRMLIDAGLSNLEADFKIEEVDDATEYAI